MRLLITGGAGSLGANIIDAYVGRPGVEILALDNFATGHRESIPHVPNVEVVEGSIADDRLVMACFERFRPTHVIHSAASYKDPDDWEEDVRTNVTGAVNVARAAIRIGVSRVINFQTALCYGRPARVPTPVDHPLNPTTSYAITKTAGEQLLLMSGLPVTSFRLATVIAPRLAIGPIPTFYQRLKAGKSCFCSAAVRDFMDVSDFLALLEKALADGAPSGVFNASPGTGVSIREIFDAVARFLNVEPDQEPPTVPVGPDDVPEIVLDPSLTEAVFDWRVRVSFEESIARMLSWYDEHGVTAIYSHVRPPTFGKP